MSKTILFDSDQAATYRTDIKGWVSFKGNFYGDGEHGERAARFDGCTHQLCDDCGETIDKHRLRCDSCYHKSAVARYEAMPFKEWDHKTPLYSNDFDEYIFEGIDEFLEGKVENGDIENYDHQSLRLVICEPVHLSNIDDDYWADDLPEDYDLPDDVEKALTEFNEVLTEAGTISWRPGKFRTSMREVA